MKFIFNPITKQMDLVSTGQQGPQGPAGADGADGVDGVDGVDGSDGAQGPAGADGADGAQGPAGPQGATGATGPQGPTGATGPAGADGADGAQGPQGPAGAAGADGADGADGAAGQGVPTGGSANQVLAKVDGTDYNTQWVNQSGGGGSSLSTAVYTGPTTSTVSATSATYVTVPVSTSYGTPASIYSNSNGVVTLGAAGTYLCMCTVVITGTTSNYRWGGELNIRHNTGSGLTEIGSVQGGYIRQASGQNDTYLSISRIVTTSDANDTIDFQLRRINTIAGNATYLQNLSTIQIIKLDGVEGATGCGG